MTTLADAIPIEQARVRELLKRYHSIGPIGVFGELRDLDAADESFTPHGIPRSRRPIELRDAGRGLPMPYSFEDED